TPARRLDRSGEGRVHGALKAETSLGVGKAQACPPAPRIRVKPSSRKFSTFQKFGFAVLSAHPASIAEGRIAIVTTREAGSRWTRMCRSTDGIFCGRRSRVVLARPCRRQAGRDADASWPTTVANKLVHRGEPEVSRKPLRREGRCDSALPVVIPVCAFRAIFAHGAAGAAGTRPSHG